MSRSAQLATPRTVVPQKATLIPQDDDEEEEEAQLPFCLRYKSAMGAVVIIGFYIVGIIFGTYFEKLDIVTSAYIIMQIVTTIGYGDITVKTNEMRIFMTIYVLVAVFFVSSLINDIGQSLVDRDQNIIRQSLSEAASNKRAGKKPKPISHSARLHLPQLGASVALFFVFFLFGVIFYGTYENCSCSYGATEFSNCTDWVDKMENASKVDNCKDPGSSSTNMIGGGKDWIEAIYMTVITLATVGFGDFTPLSQLGRGIGIFWMFFGVLSMANMVSCLSTTLKALENRQKSTQMVTSDMLAKYDSGKKGGLNEGDFLKYMLVKHNLVTSADLDQVLEVFDSMPKQNGIVSYEEIEYTFAHDEDPST